MFILQKILSNIIISPGIFIILMILILGYSFNKKKLKRARLLLLFMMFLTYILSITPTKDKIVRPLEDKYSPITSAQLEDGDCYIVLGGGAYRNAPTSLGGAKGMPTNSAMARIVEGVKLYKKSPKKIIITGGKVYGEEVSEAQIYSQVMIGLGVPKGDILLEEKSKTTEENAEFTRSITSEFGYKNPILITSATHMARSKYIFDKNEIEVIPAPTDYRATYKKSYNIDDYFPNSRNFLDIEMAVWERIGSIFYRVK